MSTSSSFPGPDRKDKSPIQDDDGGLPPPPPPITEAVKMISLDSFKQVTQMPCFRESMLYAIGTGSAIAGATVIFGGGARQKAMRRAYNYFFGTSILVSLASWFICQRSLALERSQMQELRERYRQKTALLREREEAKEREAWEERKRKVLEEKEKQKGWWKFW